MRLNYLVAAGLAPAMANASFSRRAVLCDFATAPDKGATCESFASSWGLELSELKTLNPGVTCPSIDTSKEYCVIGTFTDDPISTSTRSSSTTQKTSTTLITTTSAPKTTTTSQVPSPSNQPQMPNLASNCDGFYKVSSGDSCDAIAKKYGISTTQFLSWNGEVNSQCANLWLDYYVCVHVPGVATTTKATATPTPTASPYQPQMPGIVSNCKKYYKVKSGDSCWSIYGSAGITLQQFLAYNTFVDSTCSNLWLDYYVCTGI